LISNDTKNLIEAISTIVQSMSAVAVAFIALYGLQTWRRQMIGQRRYEVVHKLLLLARKFRVAFSKSRSSHISSYEYESRERNKDDTPEIAEIFDEHYARIAKLAPSWQIYIEIEQVVWEAEIITGEDISTLAKPFQEVLLVLKKALGDYVRSQMRMSRHPPDNNIDADDVNLYEQSRKLLCSDEPDELNKSVDDAVARLERQLRTYIR